VAGLSGVALLDHAPVVPRQTQEPRRRSAHLRHARPDKLGLRPPGGGNRPRREHEVGMNARARQLTLSGWANFPREQAMVYRPERHREIREIVAAAPEPDLISRG